jgi:hypothetical protein
MIGWAAYARIDFMKRALSTGLALATLGIALLACGNDGAPPIESTTSWVTSGRRVAYWNGTSYGAECANDTLCGGTAGSCCLGGACSPKGWCSPRCESDAECPAGFFCVDHGERRCFYGCANDQTCANGFVCDDKNGRKTCRYK